MRITIRFRLPMTAALLAVCALAAHGASLNVGSKRFTESYILGEILKQTAGLALS